MKGHIYIIHVREFIGTDIYKVGRTTDIVRRFKQYPKQSALLYNIYVNNCLIIEKAILNVLEPYVCNEYGREYVKIDFEKVKNKINEITNLYTFIKRCITSSYTVLCNDQCCGYVKDNIECYLDQLLYMLPKEYGEDTLNVVLKEMERHKEIETRDCFYYGKVITIKGKMKTA